MGKFADPDEIKSRIESIHPGKFEYDKFKYLAMREKVIVKCKVHGYKEVYPYVLLRGSGCIDCGRESSKQVQLKMNTEESIIESKKLNGDKYTYDESVYVNRETKIKAFCTICNIPVLLSPYNHLNGGNHFRCIENNKTRRRKELHTTKKSNQERYAMEWQYNENWSEEDLLSGEYCGFVYLFQFADQTSYIGSKQLYKKVKNYKKIKDTSVENGWRDYTSSSVIVNEKITEGIEYTKTILWAFPTMSETLFVEGALIMNEGLKPYNLNLAVSLRGKFPTGKNAKRLMGIIQQLQEILN